MRRTFPAEPVNPLNLFRTQSKGSTPHGLPLTPDS